MQIHEPAPRITHRMHVVTNTRGPARSAVRTSLTSRSHSPATLEVNAVAPCSRRTYKEETEARGPSHLQGCACTCQSKAMDAGDQTLQPKGDQDRPQCLCTSPCSLHSSTRPALSA